MTDRKAVLDAVALRIRPLLASAARSSDFWAFVLAAAFFAVNLMTLGHYGMSFDEPHGMERGRKTVAFIAGLLASNAPDQVSSGGFHHHPTFYAT